MYSVAGYGKMIADRERMDAYIGAMRQVVRPGSVVLDIGCGMGIFALLACQIGARRVYAVEPDDAIQVARELAVENGYEDRIVFIQDRSDRIGLPEKADVVVSDLRGVLPLFQQHLPSVIDARKRFLASAGILIPQRDTLWAAVADAPDLHNRYFGGLDEDSYGLKMNAARTIVANTWSKARVEPQQVIVEPQCWATLDYRTISDANTSGELTWTMTQSRKGSGLIVWFDSLLIHGVTMSNAPSAPELIYGNAFFPWPEPVDLDAGDRIRVNLKAQLVGQDYLWCWDTSVFEPAQPERVKTRFNQSTFFGAPLSTTSLHLRAENHVPQLDADGKIDQFILSSMDGGTAVGDIAHRLLIQFPGHFADWQAGLARVGDLAQRYGRSADAKEFRRRDSCPR